MFTFYKYPSIENVSNLRTLSRITELGYDKGTWLVGLKVHGANHGFMTDGTTVIATKRSGILVPEDGSFYGYQNILAAYQAKILDFYKFLSSAYPFKVLTLFGELFGGRYNHPDVKRDTTATVVQKGVDYCPHNDFFLFDVKLDGFFLDKNYVSLACDNYGFIGNKPLFKGSFEECIKYPNIFPDPLHKTWNLPEIEGNVCEGVVIEPEIPLFFPIGDRVILKNKNEKFAEKASKKEKVPKTQFVWSTEGAEECSITFLYLVPNRLRNVLSHIGQVTEKDFGKVMGLFVQDALKDYLKDNEEKFNILDKKEQDMIKKEMQRKAADIIRPNFRDIVNNCF